MTADMFRKNPLIAFSPASDSHYRCLLHTASEYRRLMRESIIGENKIDGEVMSRAQGYFWLFVLGSYEVTRTLRIKGRRAVPKLAETLHALEKRIKVLRIPMAKQEFRWKA